MVQQAENSCKTGDRCTVASQDKLAVERLETEEAEQFTYWTVTACAAFSAVAVR